MLLILLLEVAQLAVQLIQCVFKVLNLCHSVCSFVGRARNRVLILLQQIRNGCNTMIIILSLGM